MRAADVELGDLLLLDDEHEWVVVDTAPEPDIVEDSLLSLTWRSDADDYGDLGLPDDAEVSIRKPARVDLAIDTRRAFGDIDGGWMVRMTKYRGQGDRSSLAEGAGLDTDDELSLILLAPFVLGALVAGLPVLAARATEWLVAHQVLVAASSSPIWALPGADGAGLDVRRW